MGKLTVGVSCFTIKFLTKGMIEDISIFILNGNIWKWYNYYVDVFSKSRMLKNSGYITS